MASIYEFHVAGQVGSVIRAALPEMEAFELRSGRTLHGTAAERCEIDRLLELIQTFNLTVQRLQICERADALTSPAALTSLAGVASPAQPPKQTAPA
jgi:hypothetical protein